MYCWVLSLTCQMCYRSGQWVVSADTYRNISRWTTPWSTLPWGHMTDSEDNPSERSSYQTHRTLARHIVIASHAFRVERPWIIYPGPPSEHVLGATRQRGIKKTCLGIRSLYCIVVVLHLSSTYLAIPYLPTSPPENVSKGYPWDGSDSDLLDA